MSRIASLALGPKDGGYHDIDNGPTLQWMIANQMKPDVATLFAAAIGLRPTEELYDIRTDPSCLNNLAGPRIPSGSPRTLEATENLSSQYG